MPLLPLRTRVRKAALARLEDIKAGTTYWATPSRVTEALLAPDQYDADLALGPVVGVTRAPGSVIIPMTHDDPVPSEENDGAPPGCAVEIRFATFAYVKGSLVDGEPLAGDLLDQVQQDIETALMAEDRTLDGLVSDLRTDGEDWNDGGEAEPYAMSLQPWLARIWP